MVFKKLIQSLKNLEWRLYLSLLIMGLCPAIYTTVRVYFLSNLPNEYSYSIAGQLEWINLIYEVINESITLPLFYFIGKVISDKEELINRMKTGLLITSIIYIVLTIIIGIFAKQMLELMAADPKIIDDSIFYIRIEAVANIFSVLYSFGWTGLLTIGKDKIIYILTGVKLVLCIIFDIFFVSTLSVSLNLGVNGIGYTNLAVNFLLFICSIILLHKEKVYVFSCGKL